jgi:hypothetical protein
MKKTLIYSPNTELAIPFTSYEKNPLIYSPNTELAIPFTGYEKNHLFIHQIQN